MTDRPVKSLTGLPLSLEIMRFNMDCGLEETSNKIAGKGTFTV